MFYFSHFQSKGIEHGITQKGDVLPEGAILPQQIHTDRSAWVDATAHTPIAAVDAVLTKERGVTLAVRTADCVPILFADPRAGIVGAVHAGWRGTAMEVTRKAIEALKRPAHHVLVGLGPAICEQCFEVGEEVATQFDRSVVTTHEEKWRVDLWQANVLQLLDAGVLQKNIEILKICTYEDPTLHSFRQGERENHNFAYIRK